MKLNLLMAAAAVALAAASAAQAGTPALSYSSNTGDSLGNGPFTLGWEFTVSSAISVDGLGVFDDSLDGLAQSHDVGIWDGLGNLLTSATVGSGTSAGLIDNFRYVSVAPVTLGVGDYFIGAFWADGSDPNTFPGDSGVVSTIAAIQYVQGSFAGGGSLSDPTNGIGAGPGYFGPNFTATSGAVPEPAAWGLMLTGFFGAGAVLRANRRRAALA